MTLEEIKKLIAGDEGKMVEVEETTGPHSEMLLAKVVLSM